MWIGRRSIRLAQRSLEIIDSLDLDKTVLGQLVRNGLGKFLYEFTGLLLKNTKIRSVLKENCQNLVSQGLGSWIDSTLSSAFGSRWDFVVRRRVTDLPITGDAFRFVYKIVDSARTWSSILAEPFSNRSAYEPLTTDIEYLPVYSFQRSQTRDSVNLKLSGFYRARPVGLSSRESAGVGFFSSISLSSENYYTVLKSIRNLRYYFTTQTVRRFPFGKLYRMGTRRGSQIMPGSIGSDEDAIDRLMAVPFAHANLAQSLLHPDTGALPIRLPDLVWGPIGLVKRWEGEPYLVFSDYLDIFAYAAGIYEGNSATCAIYSGINEVFYIPFATLVKPAFNASDTDDLIRYHLLFFKLAQRGDRVKILMPSERNLDEAKNSAFVEFAFTISGSRNKVKVLFPSANVAHQLYGKSPNDILHLPCDYAEDILSKVNIFGSYSTSEEFVLLWLEPIGFNSSKSLEDIVDFPRIGIYLSRRPSEFTGAPSLYDKYRRRDFLRGTPKLREVSRDLAKRLA